MALSATGSRYQPTGQFNINFHANQDSWVQSGMMPLRKCQNQVLTPQQNANRHGWPCHLGGSTGITQRNQRGGGPINCMIFYNQPKPAPPRVSPPLQRNRLLRLEAAVAACATQQRFEDPRSRVPIYLTTLAICIEDLYPNQVSVPFEGAASMVLLRGLAVIPCSPADAHVEGLGYELLAPGGQMVEHRTDGIAFEDLNVLPLSICYVAMLCAVRG